MRRLSLLAVVWVVLGAPAVSQEPTGGIVRTLTLFEETLNDTVRYHAYSTNPAQLDTALAYSGRNSLKLVSVGNWPGILTIWHGIPGSNDYWGPDTSVFWPHPDSRLQFAIRASQGGTTVGINARGFDGAVVGSVHTFTMPPTNTWDVVDVPIPESMRNSPLKGFEIGFGNLSVGSTIWIDDFRVTNVRMYAGGAPIPPLDMPQIAASQIGFAPFVRKQFTAPDSFATFSIIRTSDAATVYTGGIPIRVVRSDYVRRSPAYIGDFTSFTTPGRYKIVAAAKESHPFNIGLDVYDGALRDAQRYFYYQRAFTAITMPYAEGPWQHPSDANRAPAGVVKGWHDAGDLSIYMPTMTQAIFWLLEAYMDFPQLASNDTTNIPESNNGIPDLLDEARWGLEWVLSMQDTSGGFWHEAYAGDQFYCSTTPNTVGQYIKCNKVSAQQTAKAVAVLAIASKVYLPLDNAFALLCQRKAVEGWNFILTHPNQLDDFGDCGAQTGYPQGNDQALYRTNKMWAAAALLYATGEAGYQQAFAANYVRVDWISSFSKSNTFAAKTYLRCTTNANATTQQEIINDIRYLSDIVRSDADAHPFKVATYYYWGSTSNAMHRTGQFSWQAYRLDTTRSADRDALLDNISYVYGRNYLNIAYVSGADRWGATNWRREGFHHWMKALRASPFHFPGALAGGPNQAPDAADVSRPPCSFAYFGDPRYPRGSLTPIEGRFTDNDSWSTNENAVNWNAALVYNLYAAKSVARGGSASPLPFGNFTAAPDSLPPGGGTVTLSWSSLNGISAFIDQGIGNVPLNGSRNVSIGASRTFTLTLTNSAGSRTLSTRVVVGAVGAGPQDITAGGTPVALIINPGGGGNHDIEVIRDGETPPVGGGTQQQQYDTYTDGGARTFDWIGYEFPSPRNFGRVFYQEGLHYGNGGWFSELRVQVRVAGQWIDAQNLVSNPVYPGINNGTSFETFDLTFAPITGDGIRIAGTPGMNAFISVAELRVFTAGATSTGNPEITEDCALSPNYPNPFNPKTRFQFSVPSPGRVRVTIYDMLGREIRTLFDEAAHEGIHNLEWDGTNNAGGKVSSGTYLYRMNAPGFVETKKMILLN